MGSRSPEGKPKGNVEEKSLWLETRSTTRAIKVHGSPNVKNSIALISTTLTLISDPLCNGCDILKALERTKDDDEPQNSANDH